MLQYQNVFRLSKNDSGNKDTQSKVLKRNRQTVSCLPCKTRKLKCDRQFPCSSCLKRKDGYGCRYANGVPSARTRREGVSEAQLRLQKLEKMVSSLVATNNSSAHDGLGSENEQNNSVDTRLERLSIDKAHSHSRSRLTDGIDSDINYLGATHWAAVLENIRDIQGILVDQPDSEKLDAIDSRSQAASAFDITFNGNPSSLKLAEFLSSLPPRHIIDYILSYFFNSKNLQIPIIHEKKFMREYEAFWGDHTSASFLWISVLFSILHIGTQLIRATNGENKYPLGDIATSVFLTRASQALAVGQYHKPKPYCIEAIVLIAGAKFMRRDDPDADAWMIMGFGARLAMKMGYNRDPKFFPNLSPFEGEMRRRTFMVVCSFTYCFHFRFGFQAGLPPIIHEEYYDTAEPSNLLDSDFDEECEALPPPRPDTDPTPMLYYSFKSRLARILRSIIPDTLTHTPRPYERTMELDEEVRRIYSDGPASLKMQSFTEAMEDNTFITLGKLNTSLIYLKCLSILHRNYLSYGRSNRTFDYSRKACTDAALQVLSYQSEIHFACQPGGPFYSNSWMLSSLILHDFLLAAMILCVDLYEYNKAGIHSAESLRDQVQKYDALKLSRDIWLSRTDRCRDSNQAANVLAYMLTKVPRPDATATTSDLSKHDSTMLGESQCFNGVLDILSETVDAPSYVPTEGGEFLDLDFNFDDTVYSNFGNGGVDWAVLDQFIYGRPNDDDTSTEWALIDG